MAACCLVSGKENDMKIRKAVVNDLPVLQTIFAQARTYMRMHGNQNQWINGYPQEEVMLQDISVGACHVCVEGERIIGVFSYFPGPDPTYAYIEDGTWPDERDYGVIHRIAVTDHRKGVASFCYHYALEKCPVLRIDTHEENIPMQKSLLKNDFRRCGIIYLANGDPRVAFYKSI